MIKIKPEKVGGLLGVYVQELGLTNLGVDEFGQLRDLDTGRKLGKNPDTISLARGSNGKAEGSKRV